MLNALKKIFLGAFGLSMSCYFTNNEKYVKLILTDSYWLWLMGHVVLQELRQISIIRKTEVSEGVFVKESGENVYKVDFKRKIAQFLPSHA